MSRSRLLAGAAAPCLFLAVPAVAQITAAPAADIIVTATRSAQPLAKIPASVSVVTAQDIADTPARTIDDVLRRVPSVDLPIASTNEQHPTDTIVSMRGLSGIRSLVLLDGVPLNDSFFGYVQWSEVPLEAVDRVEVVRGGGATLWGNYAMGGVINILTRPVDKTGLDAEAAGGNRGSYRVDGTATLAGNGCGLGVDGGIGHSNGYLEQVRGYRGSIDVPTSFTVRTAAVSGNVALAPNLTARGRVSYYDNDQNYLTRLQTNTQRNWRATGTLSWKPTDRSTVDLTGFHVDERFVTNNTGAPDGADPNEVEFVQNRHLTRANDWGASLVWTRSFDGVLRSLSAGADYHGISGSDNAAIFDQTNAYLRTDTGSGSQRFLGGFVQADLRPTARLQLLLSLRYQDFLNFNGLDASPGGLGRVHSRHESDVDPRLSVRYQLPAGFALRGAYYRAFRAPTLDNLYRSASVPGYILYANAALKPEKVIFHLHGELLAGKAGSYLVEVAACWTVVMLLTGLYLWWPRGRRGLAGVLYPRLNARGRLFWRDLHATAGIWVSVFALALILTGLPWAEGWGSYLTEIRRLTGTAEGPVGWPIGGTVPKADPALGPHAGHTGMAMPHALVRAGELARVIATVRPLSVAPPVLISPPAEPGAPWSAASDSADRPLRSDLKVDGASGRLISRTAFAQHHWIDRTIGYGIAAHEGALFGFANQILGTATALFLMILSISGAVMWWRRRPVGLLGAPIPSSRARFGPGLVAAIVALALYLPMFGITLAAVLLAERTVLGRLPAARR